MFVPNVKLRRSCFLPDNGQRNYAITH